MRTINYTLICAMFLLIACGENTEQQTSAANDFNKPRLVCDIDTINALTAWGCVNSYAYISLNEKNYLQIQADFSLLKDGQCITFDSNAVKSNTVKLTLLSYKTEGIHNVGCSDITISNDETPELYTADANYSIKIRSRKTEYTTYVCLELKNVNFTELGLHYEIITTKEIDVSNTPG